MGIRELRALLAKRPEADERVVVLAREGFTEGALALAGALPRVVLCVP